MTTLPSVTFSEQGDILYVELEESSVAKTRAYGDDRLVDFGSDGQVIGAEFIGIASSVDLRGLPETERLREAITSYGNGRLSVLVNPVEVSQ